MLQIFIMFYNSIHNKLNIKSFIDVFLSSIPKDKTLYFPFYIKKINKKKIEELKKIDYINFSFFISKLFINNIPENDLFEIINKSYSNFNFGNVISINSFENNFFLNLNHGSTLTFKDIALKPLSFLLNYVSNKICKKSVVFCATSGDTGSSAINNFKNFSSIKIFTFHPFNSISVIQRKQMTTLIKNNIFNISVLGNFDTTQYLIKKIFENILFEKNIFLTSVNSINWFRIIFQIIYYCYISLKIFKDKKINFYIPSGNFGNALAAYIAKILGFPINKIIVCNNDNCYLDKFLKNRDLDENCLFRTISPSIDISIPSNFKRIIVNYEKNNNKNLNFINNSFYSDKIYNKYIINSIEYFFLKYKKVFDPHTIVSFTALEKENNIKIENQNIVVSTSYPIKFFFSIKKIIPIININFNKKKIFFLNEKYKIFPQNFKIIFNFIKKNI